MQAARGATLTSPEGSASGHGHGANTRLRVLAIAVAACGLTVDQLTKAIASAKMPDHVHVIGSLLQLELVHNAGAAFSTMGQARAMANAIDMRFFMVRRA